MIPQNKPNPQPPSSYLSFILQIKSFVLKKNKIRFQPRKCPQNTTNRAHVRFCLCKADKFWYLFVIPPRLPGSSRDGGTVYLCKSILTHGRQANKVELIPGSLIVRKSLSIRYSDLLNQIKPWEVCTYSLTLIAKNSLLFFYSILHFWKLTSMLGVRSLYCHYLNLVLILSNMTDFLRSLKKSVFFFLLSGFYSVSVA